MCVVWIDGYAKLVEPDAYYSSRSFYEYEKKNLPLVWLVWRTEALPAGIWAVTHERRWEELHIVNFRKIATPAHIKEAKQLYIAFDPRYPRAADARASHYRPRWGGIAVDLVTLVVALLFLDSLSWIDSIVITSRGKRRLAKGLCPKCAYDLTGLRPERASDPALSDEPSARCPECGQPLPPDAV